MCTYKCTNVLAIYIYVIYNIHDRVHLWVLGFPHNKHGASGLTYEYDLNEPGSPNFTSGLWWPKRIYIYIHRAYTLKILYIYIYILHIYVQFFCIYRATFPTVFFCSDRADFVWFFRKAIGFWRIPGPLSELEIPRAGRPTESEVQVFMPWLGPKIKKEVFVWDIWG